MGMYQNLDIGVYKGCSENRYLVVDLWKSPFGIKIKGAKGFCCEIRGRYDNRQNGSKQKKLANLSGNEKGFRSGISIPRVSIRIFLWYSETLASQYLLEYNMITDDDFHNTLLIFFEKEGLFRLR